MNVMIMGGKAEPAAAKSCAVHLELEARLARIEACVAALEKALSPGRSGRSSTTKNPKHSSDSQARPPKSAKPGDARQPGKSDGASCVGGKR